MKTSSCKAKGRRLAARVREMLRKAAPVILPDDIHVQSSGVNGPDLILSPKAKEIFNFAIECKNTEKLNVWDAIVQAEIHALGTDQIPIVVFSRNRHKDYVIIEAENFFERWPQGQIFFERWPMNQGEKK